MNTLATGPVAAFPFFGQKKPRDFHHWTPRDIWIGDKVVIEGRPGRGFEVKAIIPNRATGQTMAISSGDGGAMLIRHAGGGQARYKFPQRYVDIWTIITRGKRKIEVLFDTRSQQSVRRLELREPQPPRKA